MLGLALVIVALVWKLGGGTGVAYASVLILATVPGLPLGLRSFGSRHPAAWLTGAICGYGLSSIAVWVARVSGLPSTRTVRVGWVCFGGAAWVLARPAGLRAPWLSRPAWTRRDRLALAVVLLLVPVVVGPPFSRINSQDAQGNERIHAYFTAD